MKFNLFAFGIHFLVTFLAITIGSFILWDFSNGYEGIVLIFGVLVTNISIGYTLPKDKRLLAKQNQGVKE